MKKFTHLFLFVLVNLTFLKGFGQASGEQCFIKSSDPNTVHAKITWTYNSGDQTYTVRTTFSKGFVDNTYGTNAIGWPNGHKFNDLVGSDHLQLALYDASNTKKLEFKIDYISASSAAPSGYKTLGVTGGDGKMIVGSSSDVVSAKTSLDANFNDYNYVLTTNSPATDANYTANPSYPNWIYDVWYEVKVKASAFGTSGFGYPSIAGVHASPSKTGNNTETVVPGPCPGTLKLGNQIWDDENNDGTKQSTEKGISGLSVRLYNDSDGNNVADGAAIASTTTDANGYYYFSNLNDGKYIVGVTKANGYAMSGTAMFSNNPNADQDNDNNGVNDLGSEIRSNYITLAKGTEPTNDGDDNNGNLTLDIGLHKVSSSPDGGEICFASPTKPNIVNARIQYIVNPSNGTLTIRVIFAKTFVDNTYGTNVIGWSKHNFGDLVGSDHVELALYDANNTKKMDFKLDYISSSSAAPSGYKSLGVTGGDGKMILGSASDVISAKSSLDANFNDYGYIYTTNSPATDTAYSPNPAAPNWIYDVWYETTVKLSAFGTAGFGRVEIPSVHASPSKTGSNTEIVEPKPCPSILNLGDLVFKDVNDNGVKDSTEPGIAGVTVKLYADNNGDNIADGAAIKSTVTDANGKYMFTDLAAGKYIVGIVVPSGYTGAVTTSTSANPDNDINNDNNGVNNSAGEIRSNFITLSVSNEPFNDGDDNDGNLTMDFGLKVVVASNLNLGNLVWNDQNADGVKNGTEPGMGNVRVRLYKDANGDNTPDGPAIDSTLTSASGIYNFTNLGEGKYIVGIVLPAGYVSTVATSTSFNPDNDADNDNNGIVTVNGSEVQSRSITLTANSEPTNDGDGANGNLSLDFGVRVCGTLSIGDYVWEDTDKNGLQGDDEYGIADVKVTLTMPDGSTVVTYTNADGFYYFTNLLPGNYQVKFETPTGYRATVKDAGADYRDSDIGPDGIVNVTLTNTPPGDFTIDAGYVKVLLTLGNEVFNDLNANGVRDAGEPGIGGLTVNLYKDNNGDNIPDGLMIATTTTDAAGNYLFTDLQPGSYIVGVQLPSNVWQNGPIPFTGTYPNNNIDKDNNGITTFNNEVFSSYITLTGGDEPTNDGDGVDGNLTLDFGLVQCPPPPFSINLGNKVWSDVNGNGVYDNGEPGVANAKVYLYQDANGDSAPDGPAIDSVFASADGTYGFNNVDNGKYVVGVVLPNGYTLGNVVGTSANPDNDIDNDNNGVKLVNGEVRSNTITLTAGTEPTNDGDNNNGNLTLDFGLKPSGNSSIGDFVWHDYNRNGIQDVGEPGFAGVVVKLTGPGGSVVTDTTDVNGYYQFSNLVSGTYTVCFQTPVPTAYIPSPANQGADDTKDSDPVGGCVTVVLASNETNNTVDAGFYDDIDDDDDGILDIVEGHGYDALMDCDGDGIPNYKDDTPGCPTPPGNDIYGNPFKPLTWTDCDGNGINDFFDFDKDGIIDELDLDSDNDGILDAWETRDAKMVDANKDGMVDGADDDGDGLRNSADGTINTYGGPGLTPGDLDRDGLPNYTDIDSDGDGITDLTEATGNYDSDGLANGTDLDGDGVNESVDNIPGMGARGVTLLDRDNDGRPNPYDIDSDNDGITDNVEGQPTCSEVQPSGNDTDKDGLDNVYDVDNNICVPRGGGIRPYDKDGDTTPDIYDLDTDNDGAPDENEGSGIYGPFVTNFNDTDDDGLIDQFDVFNIKTATSLFTHNVGHNEMGPNGNFDGPSPSGSNARLPKSKWGGCAEGTDRDWRDVSSLPVTWVEFKGNLYNGKVNLTWTVANETNIDAYQVERSVNGGTYKAVGNVKAINSSANHSYSFSDDVTTIPNGTVFYRVKQVETTGAGKLSNVINFKLSGKGNNLTIYPNPVNSYFTAKVNAKKDGMATIRVTDYLGKVMFVQSHNMTTGTNAITFSNLDNLKSGTYNLQVILNGEVLNEKLIIVK